MNNTGCNSCDIHAGYTNSFFDAISPLPNDTVTAMAYIPFQTDTRMYEPEKALCAGTLFPDLDKPFCRAAIK